MNFILSTEGVKSLQKKPFILTFFSIKCESTPSKKGNFTETITYIFKKKNSGIAAYLSKFTAAEARCPASPEAGLDRLNPKYALAILLRPVIASKSVTTLLFSTSP